MLGGPIELIDFEKDFQNDYDKWLGVDGGAVYLLNKQIPVDVAIGDFDSVSATNMEKITKEARKVIAFEAEKDDTDTEISLLYALNELEATKIDIFGATGGRIDHLLSNLLMVNQPRFKQFASRITFRDKTNTISFYLPGKYFIKKEIDKKYISFIGLSAIEKLVLKDFKYNLDATSYAYSPALVSNEFVEKEAYFSYNKGLIMVVQSKDA